MMILQVSFAERWIIIMKKMEGKVFLGYGTGAGMGRATALLYAQEGAKVIVASNPGNGEKTTADIQALGGEALFVATNCMKEEDIIAAAEVAIQKYGKIDVMLYQPGIGHCGSMLDDDIDAWKPVFELNTYGAARAIKAVGRHMKENGGGSIIITSSLSALCPSTENACYCASKAGVNAVVKVAAMELGPEVRVNAINPGLTNTKAIAPLSANAAAREKLMANLPMKRLGEAEDIAKAALFLGSDDSSFITGINLTVDGGMHLYSFPTWISHPEAVME